MVIEVEADGSGDTSLEDLATAEPGVVTRIEAKRFDGDSAIRYLVDLTALSLPFVTRIVIERIRARKNCVVRHKGTVVQGLLPETAELVLKELLARDNDATGRKSE